MNITNPTERLTKFDWVGWALSIGACTCVWLAMLVVCDTATDFIGAAVFSLPENHIAVTLGYIALMIGMIAPYMKAVKKITLGIVRWRFYCAIKEFAAHRPPDMSPELEAAFDKALEGCLALYEDMRKDNG